MRVKSHKRAKVRTPDPVREKVLKYRALLQSATASTMPEETLDELCGQYESFLVHKEMMKIVEEIHDS